jgi:hypothetical protein
MYALHNYAHKSSAASAGLALTAELIARSPYSHHLQRNREISAISLIGGCGLYCISILEGNYSARALRVDFPKFAKQINFSESVLHQYLHSVDWSTAVMKR